MCICICIFIYVRLEAGCTVNVAGKPGHGWLETLRSVRDQQLSSVYKSIARNVIIQPLYSSSSKDMAAQRQREVCPVSFGRACCPWLASDGHVSVPIQKGDTVPDTDR